jgi:hypothetical protein
MDRQRLSDLEQQMAKFMFVKQPSNTNTKGNTSFTGKVKELMVPPSSINDFYVNMKNKLIIVSILILAILWYFKPPQIMTTNNKNKVKTIDYKNLVKYWLIITFILYIGLFYYYKKYM